jgi:hypothetical protein
MNQDSGFCIRPPDPSCTSTQLLRETDRFDPIASSDRMECATQGGDGATPPDESEPAMARRTSRQAAGREPLFTRYPDHPDFAEQTIYCWDNLRELRKFPDECVDLIYIDPPFNSNRNYEVFWGEARETRAFEGFCL